MNTNNYYEIGLGPHEGEVSTSSSSHFKKLRFHITGAFSHKGSISSLILIVSIVTFVVNTVFFYFFFANNQINDNVQKPANSSLIASFVDSL